MLLIPDRNAGQNRFGQGATKIFTDSGDMIEIVRLSGLFGQPDEDAEDTHCPLRGEDGIGLAENPRIEIAGSLPAKLDIAADKRALEIGRHRHPGILGQ